MDQVPFLANQRQRQLLWFYYDYRADLAYRERAEQQYLEFKASLIVANSLFIIVIITTIKNVFC